MSGENVGNDPAGWEAEMCTAAKGEPSWFEVDFDPSRVEEWCVEWRERHQLAFVELAELCGLAALDGAGVRETGHHDEARVAAVFEALQSLVSIDPDGRR